MRDPRKFYRDVLGVLTAARVPYLIGGAVAQARYTGIHRTTKDLDLVVRRRDWSEAARALRAHGIYATLPFPHWLGKALSNGHQVDIIFGSGNGQIEVDDHWFERATPAKVLGRAVRLCSPEDLLWSKAFIMERERFDGADVLHLVLRQGEAMDWAYLCERFAGHEAVLYAHLILFGYVYPQDTTCVPEWVMERLHAAATLRRHARARVCRGTLLSRAQYLADLSAWGYADARLPPHGHMTARERAIWTRAIGQGKGNGQPVVNDTADPQSTECR